MLTSQKDGGFESGRDWERLFRQMGETVAALRAALALCADPEALRLLDEIAASESLVAVDNLVDELRLLLLRRGAIASLPPSGFSGPVTRLRSRPGDPVGLESEAPLRNILRL